MRKQIWCALLLVVVLLVGCSSSKPLTALTPPFGDAETFTYDLLVSGQKIAEPRFIVKKDQYAQQTAWLMAIDLQAGDQSEINEVWTNIATLRPLFSRIQLGSPQGDYDIRATYHEKKLNLEADTPQGEQKVERNISGAVYDNAQILMTLRALPLAEGYQTKLNFVQTKNLTRGEMVVKVVGKEKAQVPAGEFDCYKVEMSIQGAKQSCWYSVDAKHWLIKYDNGQSQFALTKTR